MDLEPHNRPRPDLDSLPPDFPEFPRFHGPRFELSFKTVGIFILLLAGTVFTTWLVGGPWFSLGLILILGTHEFGHYWACRLNNVNASLPNFIPAPPIFIAGTMGAFIIIKEPIPNRRALMEIGASGPIAGFVTAVPVLILGLMNSQVMLGSQSADEFGLFFGSSLILWGMTELVLGVNPMLTDVTITLHPLAYAGWLGMFFTALNLLPMGQLDGGHVVYSLFEKHHTWVARLFFIAMFPLGYFWSGWFIWAVLVFLLGLKHPPLIDESAPLGRNHRYIGYASILILILTFVPVPFDLLR